MKNLILTSAIALGLAAPAFANSAQLAASVGVAPGTYTLAELAQLQEARLEGDTKRIDFIVDGTNDVVSTQSTVSPGQAQIAAQLGVDASNYSLAELIQLREAVQDGDTKRISFIVNGTGDVVSTQSTVSAGEAQLAASLGLDPTQYTLAELASIAADREDDE